MSNTNTFGFQGAPGGGGGGGTVTSVAALTLGTAGADLSSTVATSTTTPVITLNVPTASALNRGALTAADWTTFNNKGSGTVTSVSSITLGTTGTDLSSTIATGTTTPVITLNVPTASALNRGALSSADWTTFNNKGNGTVLSVTAAPGDPIIVDNIDPSNPIISSGILVQGVSGTLNRIDSSGGTTPIIDISATYVGQTSITTLGTISTGIWNGTTIAILNGGTGQTTATLGFNALSPVTTRGDIIVRGVTNNDRLALGTVGKILRSDGTDLVYTTATYPTTTAVSTLLYSSAANVISALATANSGILVTSATGVPSISAQLTYVTTTGVLTSILSVNSMSRIMVTNANVGVAAACDIVANNGTASIGITQRGTAFTTTGLVVANQGMLSSSAASSMLINTTVASVPIIFAVGGTAATNEVHRSTSSGIEFRVLLKSLVHSSANLMAGQITLVGGTLAIAITGLTTSHRGMVTLVTPNNVFATRSYQAVCTLNTITIRANTDAGLLNMADTSVLNYFIFLNN